MILEARELAAIRRQAEAEYPAECCGVVLVRGGGGERRVHPCRNVQNELHARDPARFPRDARTAYYVAPEDLLEIGRLEADGWRVHVIYHSHVDADAYFSETDRRQALVDGEPAYPDAVYVVVAVHGGRSGSVRAFRWSERAREFIEVPLDAAD